MTTASICILISTVAVIAAIIGYCCLLEFVRTRRPR
jgi:hypothetical protein